VVSSPRGARVIYEPVSATVNAWSRLPGPVRELASHVILPYVAHRVLLTAVVLFAIQFVPQNRGFHVEPYVPFVDVWFRWDSVQYLIVAHGGYGATEYADPNSFFPAYPALIAALDLILPLPIAALLASNLAALTALGLLYVWAKRMDDEGIARSAVVLAILFPTSYYLTAVYAISTYLAFAIGAVVAARRGRRWLAAGLVMGACLARPQGFVCLTLPFAIGWLVRSRRRADLPWWILGSIPALGALMAVHQLFEGDPLGFLGSRGVQNMPLFWEHQRETPPFWAVMWDEGLSQNLMKRLLNWSAIGLGLAAAVHLLREKEVALALLSVLTLALPLVFFGQLFDLASMARYTLGAFPVFLVLARWLRGRRDGPVHWGFAMAQVLLFTLFASWYWVE